MPFGPGPREVVVIFSKEGFDRRSAMRMTGRARGGLCGDLAAVSFSLGAAADTAFRPRVSGTYRRALRKNA